MTPRSGFTLIEVLVATFVASVIVLLVFGTAWAAQDAHDRIVERRHVLQHQLILRQLLVDALRHPMPGGGSAMNDTLLALEDRTSSDGLPADVLRFVSRGLSTERGSGAWWVLLEGGATGARLHAVQLSDPLAAPMTATMPGVAAIDVRVLDRTGDASWQTRWETVGRSPAGVWIRFLDSNGAPAAPPLVVRASAEAMW
jgi:prepilin-type N-terminal cleavage/methylation domain-containing protein